MRVTIIADASYCHELRVGGYGYWIASERGKIGGGGRLKSDDIPNSGVAEMMALVNALHSAIVQKFVQDYDEVLMQTDCVSAIDAFQGVRKKLTAQEMQIVAFMQRLIQKGHLKLQYRHVKGHTGNTDRRSLSNAMCDKRAKQGLNAARKAKRIAPLKKLLEK